MTKTVLINVRVFDGKQITEPRTVVIDGAVIGTDPAGGHEIDASGATLLPGLIDAHVHVSDREALAALASGGVTTGLDMGCWPAERVQELKRVTGSADLRSAGLPAIGPDGFHAKGLGLPPEAIILTAEDARRHVEARVADGVDYVKGVAEAPSDGGPPAEALTALVDAARAHGLKTVVHAATVGAYTVAVESGAEFITHIPSDGAIRADDIAAMQARGQVVIPTVTMMEGIGRAPIEDLLANVAGLHRAGIEILAGTDAHTGMFPVPHGESLHHELELLVRAGIHPVDAIRKATILPARAFGLADRGTIEPGQRADLVLVDGDPTTDITATRRIRKVWCAGEAETSMRA